MHYKILAASLTACLGTIVYWLYHTSSSVIGHSLDTGITASGVGIGAFILAHPIMLAIAGSLVLCALAYVLYRWKVTAKASDSFLLDGDTRLSSRTFKSGSYSAQIYDGESRTKSATANFRTLVYNRFRTTDRTIELETKQGTLHRINIAKDSNTSETFETLQITTSEDEYLVKVTGRFEPRTLHALPSLQAVVKQADLLAIYANFSPPIDLYWDEDLQQCYFNFAGLLPQNMTLIYKLKKPSILGAEFSPEAAIENAQVLTKPPTEFFSLAFINQFKQRLMGDHRLTDPAYLEQHPNLKNLNQFLDETQELSLRLKALYDFCKNFHWERDLYPKPSAENDVETLVEIIMQYSGVCRHRSFAFTFLCQLYGIESYFIDNGGDHAYPTLRYKKTDGSICDRRVIINQIASTPALSGSDSALEEPTAFDQYYQRFKQTVSYGELRSLKEILPSGSSETPFSPLLCLTAGQSPFAVNEAIIKQLPEYDLNPLFQHLLINEPKDFAYYLSPGKLAEGRRRLERQGPLRKIVESKSEQPAVIVINWSNFSALEKAAYQSLLDKPPTLTIGDETFEIPTHVKIVGLIKTTDHAGKAFFSRAKCWDVHADFFSYQPTVAERKQPPARALDVASTKDVAEEKSTPPSTALEVDLFRTTAFEELVLGEITLEGKATTLSEGPLLIAIKENKPLTIYNPPDTERFHLLAHQVNAERKLLLPDGKMTAIPANVKLQLKTSPLSTKLPVHVKIDCENPTEDKIGKRERIHLAIHNLHECYKIITVDEKSHQASTDPKGLLGLYQEDSHVFYITGIIPLSHWQRLMAEISRQYPTKSFTFLLAPGAAIEEIQKNTYPPRVLDSKEKIDTAATTFVSNDPDLLTLELAAEIEKTTQKSPLIIDINGKTTFNELMGKISASREGFNVEKGMVLAALEKGEDIILNGEMSLALYQQLLPLLSAKPHLYFNGQRITPKGQLRVVLPASTKLKMQLLTYSEKRYDFIRYRALIKDEASQQHLDQIEKFYEMAKRLPHRGAGRPEKPYLSWQCIQSMLTALKSPLHQHNPIKSIFNFAYPSDSDDYAYLNVVGKMLFRAEDTTAPRQAKLVMLVKKWGNKTITPEHIKEHAWQLLNCFNGSQIQGILGETFAGIGRSAFPSLTKEALKKLAGNITTVLATTREEKSKRETRHAKQMRELALYLRSKSHPIILLHGPAGVGKSHAVRQLLGKDRFFEGEAGILAWLTSDGSKPLLADEMNMTGNWDFLEGLGRPDKVVIYQGKQYKLTDQHQVIGTTNPVDPRYPGRSHLKVAQNLAVTIAFKEPPDDFYRSDVLMPKLKRIESTLTACSLGAKESSELISASFISAFHLIQQYNPHIVRSIRDIENLAERFISILKTLNPKSSEEFMRLVTSSLWTKENPETAQQALKYLLLKACLGEFSLSISDRGKRSEFANTLRTSLGLPDLQEEKAERKLIQLTDKVAIPLSKRDFVEAIEQDLDMRWQALLQKAPATTREKKSTTPSTTTPESIVPYYKQSVTVEGEPGRGKSTYLRAIAFKHQAKLKMRKEVLELLQRSGTRLSQELQIEYALIKEELNKQIHAISGGSASLQPLKDAFDSECILIDDESNLNPLADELLSQYLCGVDERGNPTDNVGFLHLGSQNSSAHSGRPTVSKSKQNREHHIYLDDFSDEELETMARGKVTNPRAFVAAFRMICREYPHANMRTFHEVAKLMAEIQQARKTSGPVRSTTIEVLETSPLPGNPSHTGDTGEWLSISIGQTRSLVMTT